MLTETIDEEYALDFQAAVQEACEQANVPDLVHDLRFLERLDPLVGADPTVPAFTRLVEAAIAAHQAGNGEQVTESAGDEHEETERIPGRVIEAAGTASDGSRIFRVEIIRAGDSKNGRRYPANVLEAAVPLYEGARAYDHHRTADELRSSTINGLVGYYRNVRSTGRGLEGDLHLLPGAKHTAEALDATIAAQTAGLPPLVGISHDAMTILRPVNEGGRRVQEAVRITKVNSADVVADPAAGGQATRVLAGGIETEPESQEEDVTVTSEAVLAALQTATPEQLAAFGLSKATESTDPTHDTGAADMTVYAKSTFIAKTMVQAKVSEANLPAAVAGQLLEQLPDRITESDVDTSIASLKAVLGVAERANLVPTYTAQVTQESIDKKKAGIDGFFEGQGKGYRSFREMFIDVTGIRGPRTFDEDFNRVILRECIGGGYDSAVKRSTESIDSSTFAQLLGDSVTRRMVAEYSRPNLQTWRRIVSSTPTVNDFRTQRIGRLGGYGTLPAVNQGQPYQPLTTPGDEEATYALTKRGGTEDLTLEMVANDDVRAFQQIPVKLGLAAAQTLYRFVWDILPANANVSYEAVTLFHANHGNTTAAALSGANLSVLRRKMREQAAYGDSSDILSLIPRFLIVPPELEELAWQLCTSVVQITSNADATIPNLHQGMEPIVIDYYTDADDWYVIADPAACPTIEVGFYRGQQEPELFTQSDPTQGSMFSSDSLTLKIRHIYSGTVLDHRAFQRGTQ